MTEIPDDIMQAKTEVQLRDAISVAIDDFVGKLHSEKITSITEIIAAERAKWEAELATLRAENERLRKALKTPDADRRQWFLRNLIAEQGSFNRRDLVAAFGISVPQASHDIARLLKEYPDLADYSKTAKKYIARAALKGGE